MFIDFLWYVTAVRPMLYYTRKTDLCTHTQSVNAGGNWPIIEPLLTTWWYSQWEVLLSKMASILWYLASMSSFSNAIYRIKLGKRESPDDCCSYISNKTSESVKLGRTLELSMSQSLGKSWKYSTPCLIGLISKRDQKLYGSSYHSEVSLHTKFQTPSTFPSC